VSRYQKGKTNLDFTEARDSEWQWHQLGHMQVCTSFQTDNPTLTTLFFTGRMPFLLPNQQRQSTEQTSDRTKSMKDSNAQLTKAGGHQQSTQQLICQHECLMVESSSDEQTVQMALAAINRQTSDL